MIDVEFACNTSNFTGSVADTYTSAPQSFASSPYSYNTQTINIANLCPGVVYKFRIRERNSGITTSSNWSQTYTFVTTGTPVVPSLVVTASPPIICPPAPVQLQASVSNTCGFSPALFTWLPTTGLSNPNIANPVATVTAPITYTCFAYGGATGCWAVAQTIFLNVGTGPPVPGIASVTPSVLCVYNGATVSTTSFTGNIQWQVSASSLGPWNNIPGATSPSIAVPSLTAATCFRSILTSCNGSTLASNITCALTNTVPTLSPSAGCTATASTLNFSYTPSSGTPTNVIWSPAPLSVSANSLTAYYNNSGTYFALAFFPDGCIASTSINLVVPSATVNTSTVSCAALGTATVSTTNMPAGATYSWLPTTQNGTTATGLFPGTYTCIVGYNGNQCQNTTVFNMVSLAPLTTTLSHSPSALCPNAITGTAAITVGGGSGNTTYTWTNQNLTLHTPSVSGLATGVHTVSTTDMVTFCTTTQTFIINSVPDLSLTITPSSSTVCAGSAATLIAQNSGGTPGYTFSWTAGPSNATHYVTSATAGPVTYTVTSADINNCTATETIQITYIALPVINVINTAICPGNVGTLTASGANTYSWNNSPNTNGNTFTASPVVNSNYNVSGTAQGCVGNATGVIQMLAVPNASIFSNSPICNGSTLTFSANGGITYRWQGPLSFTSSAQSPFIAGAPATASGVYNLTVTGVNTCSVALSANLTVHASPPVSASGSTVCSTGSVNLYSSSLPGASFSWTGPLFTSSLQNPVFGNLSSSKSGAYTVIATSAEGCTNSAIASVSITQLPTATINADGPLCEGKTLHFQANGGVTYAWSGPAGFSSTQQNPFINQITLAASGIYNLQAFTGPCIAYASYPLTVWPLPGVIASNGGNVCETKTVQLIAQTQGSVVSYAWYGPSFASPLQNPTRYPASMQQNGEYTLTVTDANGCENSATTSVTVLHNPNVAALGATVCLYNTAVFAVNGASAYLWKGPNNFQSVLPNPSINGVDGINVGTYTVNGTAQNGCITTVTVALDTMALPVASLSVSPTNTICLTNTVLLSGSGGLNYRWFGPNSIYLEGKDVVLTASNQEFEGTYTLVAIDKNGCANSKATTIKIHPIPDAGLGGIKSGCAPFCSTFSVNAVSDKISARWQIEKTTYSSTFTKCFNQAGTYSITGVFYDSLTKCKASKTFTVQIHGSPISDFEIRPKLPIEKIDDALLINHSQGEDLTEFYWYIKYPNTTWAEEPKTGAQISQTFEEAGTYPIVLVTENKFGCTDTAIKMLEVAPDFFIYVPNVFTPNGDKTNESFKAVVRGVKLFELSIYNRWGERVFFSKDPDEGWTGYSGAKEAQSGVYTWTIKATSIHGDQRSLNGHLTLYR